MENLDKFKDKALNESSLSRVWKHTQNGFSILTAFRGEFNEKENLKRNRELQTEIRKRGYGYFKLDGHWVENMDDDSKENLDVAEESFFIPIGDKTSEEFQKDIMDFIHFFKDLPQDAAVIKTPEQDGVHLLYKNGDMELAGKKGKFKADSVAQAYSKMKHGSGDRTFVFEKAQTPTNNMGKYAFSNIGQLW
jgi:hypothetical protein